MATTDECFQKLTAELIVPGKGFWSLSQFSGSTISGQVFFKGARYGKVSGLSTHDGGQTYYAGVSGRSLNKALNDACDLVDEVAMELATLPDEDETDAEVEA